MVIVFSRSFGKSGMEVNVEQWLVDRWFRLLDEVR